MHDLTMHVYIKNTLQLNIDAYFQKFSVKANSIHYQAFCLGL